MFSKASSAGFNEALQGVHLKTLAHGERTLITEVHLRKGAVVPAHQHPQEQTGYLVSGSLRFVIGNESIVATPGDSWCLPADLEHGAEALEDTIVVEVFSPVREDYLPAASDGTRPELHRKNRNDGFAPPS